MEVKILTQLERLHSEAEEIAHGIRKAPDNEVLRWLVRRKKRNEASTVALGEILAQETNVKQIS